MEKWSWIRIRNPISTKIELVLEVHPLLPPTKFGGDLWTRSWDILRTKTVRTDTRRWSQDLAAYGAQVMRGLLKRERQQAWKRPRLVIMGRGTVLSRVYCCDAVWKWGDGAGTWLGGLTAIDRNARRRNNKQRNQIFGSNMAASISKYELATKQNTERYNLMELCLGVNYKNWQCKIITFKTLLDTFSEITIAKFWRNVNNQNEKEPWETMRKNQQPQVPDACKSGKKMWSITPVYVITFTVVQHL